MQTRVNVARVGQCRQVAVLADNVVSHGGLDNHGKATFCNNLLLAAVNRRHQRLRAKGTEDLPTNLIGGGRQSGVGGAALHYTVRDNGPRRRRLGRLLVPLHQVLHGGQSGGVLLANQRGKLILNDRLGEVNESLSLFSDGQIG